MKKIVTLALIIVLFVISSIYVFADLQPRESFEQVSEDGTRIFRYYDRDTVGGTPFASVYYNSEHQELIFTLENFFMDFGCRVYFSDDMIHIILSSFYGYRLTFFAAGERVGMIERSAFINNYSNRIYRSYPPLAHDWDWEVNWRMVNLDSSTLELTIETHENRTIVFDMTNGEILQNIANETATEHRESRNIDWWLYFIIAVIVIIIIALVLVEIFYWKSIFGRTKNK